MVNPRQGKDNERAQKDGYCNLDRLPTVYHNYYFFFRPHEGLAGKTQAEMAGIRIEGKNKWMTVIQNASKLQN
jgi:hypothetical protein